MTEPPQRRADDKAGPQVSISGSVASNMDGQVTASFVPSTPDTATALENAIKHGTMLGPYRLESKLGQGGMGAVWKARHLRLDRLVALKLLPPGMMNDRDAVLRFEQEMKTTAKLQHPNLVHVTDAGESGGIHYLVMELIDGVDLARLIRTNGPVTAAKACQILSQVASGLHESHQLGIVHRDVKPANILLDRSGKVKLLDLGLARMQSDSADREQLTRSGQILGTPAFMAPEQWDDVRTVDHRADLYALGCNLHFLLTGRAPFENEAGSGWIEQMKGHTLKPVPRLLDTSAAVDPRLEILFQQLMSKSPDDRPSSARDVELKLLAIQQELMKVEQADTERFPNELADQRQLETAKEHWNDESTRVSLTPLRETDGRGEESHRAETKYSADQRIRSGGYSVKTWILAGGLLGAFLALLSAGVMFVMRTPFGEVVIQLDDPEADVQIMVDGEEIKLTGIDEPLSLRAGEHGLTIRGDKFETTTRQFVVRKGVREVLNIQLRRTDAASNLDVVDSKDGTMGAAKDEAALTINDSTSGAASSGKADGVNEKWDRRVRGRFSGDWHLEGAEIVQRIAGPSTLIFGDPTWTDYDFSLETKSRTLEAGKQIQGGVLCFRAGTLKDLFSYSVGCYDSKWVELASWIDNKWDRRIPAKPMEFATDRWYKLSASVRGTHIVCSLDGVAIFECDDERLPSGCVGLRSWTEGVCFRNLRVTSPDGKILWEGLPILRADVPELQPSLLEGGKWSIEGNELVQALPENARIFFGSSDWSDFDLAFETLTDGAGIATPMGTRVLYRIEDSHHAHRISIGAGGGVFDEISRFDRGVVNRSRPTVPTAFTPNRWYRVNISARGNHFTCKIDDRVAFEYDDPAYPRGRVGLTTWNAPCRWRNIQVTDPTGKVLWEGLPAIP